MSATSSLPSPKGYVFANASEDNGFELWVADENFENRRLLKDINPVGVGSALSELTGLPDGRVLFVATDNVNGRELWVTDGTESGTHIVRITDPRGYTASYDSAGPQHLTELGNGKAVFSISNSGSHNELWITNGTEAGTFRFWDILRPSSPGNNNLSDFTALGNGRLLFTASNDEAGRELWVTDGTAEGTHLLGDIVPGPAGSFPTIERISPDGIATIRTEVGRWATDGTVAGTHQLSDDTSPAITYVSLGNGHWLYGAYESPEDFTQTLYVTDGTAEGTHRLVGPDADSISTFYRGQPKITLLGEGKALFQVAQDLWVTDGTEGGTHLVMETLSPDGSTDFLALGNGKVLFTNNSHSDLNGNEVWVTDGTAEGTIQLATQGRWNPSQLPSEASLLADGRVIFSAGSKDGALDAVWITDLTPGNLQRVDDMHNWMWAGAPVAVLRVLPPAEEGTPNHAPTGTLSIDGAVQPGAVVQVDVSGIADADGLGDLSYQWYLSDNNSAFAPIEGATKAEYLIRATDAGKNLHLTVSYDDGAGHHEVIWGHEPTTIPQAGTNHPNAGEVVFFQRPFEVGSEMLLAYHIEEPDGLSHREVTSQWYRDTPNGSWELVVAANQYTFTEEDIGHHFKVVTSYYDNQGHLETMTSGISPLVTPATDGETPSQPEPHQWSEQLPLFDITYYLANNPDVAQSGMDPLQHFLQFGGLEGRSPNADFDSAFYLSHYPDVTSSGLNPFLHYLAYGWQEGRMASAKNDFSMLHPEIGSPELTQLARELIFDFAHTVQTDTPVELPAGEQAQVPSSEAPSSDSAPSDAGVPENDRPADSQEGHPSHSLFDSSYYLAHNPDVAASGMNPLEHFLQFGGQEGRSPNADFDSAFYLSQNPDVVAEGLNPFLHYLAYGWREGRDASASQHGADFAAAHPDATSILSVAQAEAYLQDHVSSAGTANPGPAGAIQPSTLGSHSLVDAQFYYDTYQDVAQAGVDAFTHYMTFGWHEGRDPDALFDTSYYLDHNADVAAAGVNPMEHYLLSGAKEGRDPSALFDTDAYLQHNADVAAAGMNPLLHFLQYGVSEGRDIFHV